MFDYMDSDFWDEPSESDELIYNYAKDKKVDESEDFKKEMLLQRFEKLWGRDLIE